MNRDLSFPQGSRSRKGLGGRSEPESLGLESHREREMEYGCQAQRAGGQGSKAGSTGQESVQNREKREVFEQLRG